jgi:dsDNA-specific endonuclease/ATPase MutS2
MQLPIFVILFKSESKQVALIVIMAHVGCFVPAEYASMPAIDKIFTRITTEVQYSVSAAKKHV